MKRFYKVLMVVCIIGLGFSLFKLGTIFYKYYKLDKDNDKIRTEAKAPEHIRHPKGTDYSEEAMKKVIDFEALKKINKDVVGWIFIPDTSVDYPILKGRTNDTYLRTNILGKYENGGSIFMEASNKADFTDLNTIIYGHHMYTDSMFTAITKFNEKNVFDSHPYVYVYREDGSVQVYKIFSSNRWDAYDNIYTTDMDYRAFIGKIFSKSLFKREMDMSEGPMLMLSTCAEHGTDWRAVVHSKLVEIVPY